jgi:hypothetical protein
MNAQAAIMSLFSKVCFGSQAVLAVDAKRAMREILMTNAVNVAMGGSWA